MQTMPWKTTKPPAYLRKGCYLPYFSSNLYQTKNGLTKAKVITKWTILAEMLGRFIWAIEFDKVMYCLDLHQAVGTKPDPIIANSAVFDSSHIHSNTIEGQNKHFTWWGDSQLDFIGWYMLGRFAFQLLLNLTYCWDLQWDVRTKPDPIINNNAVFDSSHIHNSISTWLKGKTGIPHGEETHNWTLLAEMLGRFA